MLSRLALIACPTAGSIRTYYGIPYHNLKQQNLVMMSSESSRPHPPIDLLTQSIGDLSRFARADAAAGGCIRSRGRGDPEARASAPA